MIVGVTGRNWDPKNFFLIEEMMDNFYAVKKDLVKKIT